MTQMNDLLFAFELKYNNTFCRYVFELKIHVLIQWKPLNVITLGHIKIENINRMITLTGDYYLV